VLFYEHNVDGTVGGSHYCLLEICRAIDRTRFDPVVCFAQANSLLDEFRATGVQVLVTEPSRTVRLTSRRALLQTLLRPLQSVANALRTLVYDSLTWANRLRRLRIDVVHLNNSCGGDHEVVIAALLRRIPVMAHQRGYPQAVGARERWFARRLAAIAAISSSVLDDLKDKGLYSSNTVLIHDGIDPARVVASAAQGDVRARFGIPATARLVGVVGNIKEWKGQDTLIRAMRHVVLEWPDTFCLVVGAVSDKSYFDLMQRHAAEAGIGDRVVFSGYERYPAACMATMDVVVHTSTAPEPFGLVVLEAMALKKPVIATDHGGPRDIVLDGQTGFLTPPADEHALARVINVLLRDGDMRRKVGAAGHARLLECFTAAKSVGALEAVIERISPAYVK
jgi:glycosyltransferase involved in cell wall biosynthesis